MRDTSNDVDDPDASMTDPEWHRTCILSKCFSAPAIPSSGPKHILTVENGRLVFKQGIFYANSLKQLMLPTMKGFWVPISVYQDAELVLRFPELIGLKNVGNYVAGKITLISKSIKSFELAPLKGVSKLSIFECENLLDLSQMPVIDQTLNINYQQLKLNLKHIVTACSHECRLVGMSDFRLQLLINAALSRKASPNMTTRRALLQLQTELIDNGYEEYADI